jgi:hypothetical protein
MIMAKRKRGGRQEGALSGSLARALTRDLGGYQLRSTIRKDWTANMEQRADLEGRQVKCLIASEGHLWMRNYFDRFPSPIRQRLAESAFNICPACMDEEAHTTAFQRKETKPSIATYFAVIEAIERKLDQQNNE